MSVEDTIQEMKNKIRDVMPARAGITNVKFEGPDLIIYVRNPSSIMKDGDLVKKLAKKLKKRVDIRPDPNIRLSADDAREKVREIVPEDAGIQNIDFDPSTSEIIIEAVKPGLVIGKESETLRKIIRKVKWSPKVMRASPIKSKTTKTIRNVLKAESEERTEILENIGKRIYRKNNVDTKWIRITFLGGARQVGRSAALLQTNESNVLIDFGINMTGKDPEEAYPYIKAPEFSYMLQNNELDAVVVTHAHLDHSGLVPYLFKHGFYDGPIYTTYPTRDLMMLLQNDYINIAKSDPEAEAPYDEMEIKEEIKHVIPLEYEMARDIAPNVHLTFYNAGHILGSAMAHFHIGEGLYNIMFTGDLKYSSTRLLSKAHDRFPRLESVVIESTYGSKDDKQMSREKAEQTLINQITNTVDKGGKILIPVMSVGRSQEIMLILEEFYRNGQLDVPIHLDGMIWEATAIHTTYPEYLNESLVDRIFHKEKNPFLSDAFNKVESQEERMDIIDSSEPSVILATSGMLVGGPSVEYFTKLAPNPDNSIILVSYQAEGTLGRRVQKGQGRIPINGENGKRKSVDVNMDVNILDGFSGHSDRDELMKFFSNVNPKPEKALMVHGESSKTIDFTSSVYKKFNITTKNPYNLETIRLK